MNAKQLRQRLRREGFINHEIFVIHSQYLLLRTAGITDDEIVFDREHGALFAESAKEKYRAMQGKHVAPDPEYHCAYIIEGERRTKVGPFT